ncbi:hypothetical protein [Desulfuromonas sp. TF]|jgi:hypothetical protein|uniref:hypothetical protein n=1 Tax=Desulfuromonas sp. TF TaxID=1232410 RepID=UPI000420A7D6|nr:hypothetical protein [Desulfuromonas sp. TF]
MLKKFRTRLATLSFALAAILVCPLPASSHVKWFVREDSEHPVAISLFSLSEPAVQIWVLIILACITVALLLDRYLPRPPERMSAFFWQRRQQVLHLFQVMVGLALLLTAFKGAVLAPHLAEPGRIGLLLRFVEGGIGLLFIANTGVRLGACLMVGLFLASTALFGWVSSLEYFNFLGIALFLLLASLSASGPAHRLKPYALPVLRIHTGIALGVLAWTEKLIDPNLAVRFLEKTQINFMKALGIDLFSDRIFVLCAGCTELIFAIIFALGLITKVNTLAVAGFLVSSNLYFFLVGKTDEAFLELTGHLPLVAIAILLVLYGGGKRLCLTNLIFRRSRAGVAGGNPRDESPDFP